MNNQDPNKLPLVPADDGFNDGDAGDRLIQGTILRCVDGHWTDRGKAPMPPEMRLIALKTAMALQHWKEGLPVETIVKTPGMLLPNIDELNAKIQKKEWEPGLNKGEKRPPWVKQYVVYLFDPRDASAYTFINSTVGAMLAVDRLKERVTLMRMARGQQVVPIVSLGSAPMKTQMGEKKRPEFVIEDWRIFGGPSGGGGITKVTALEHLGQPVKPPTSAELMNDELPDFDRRDDGDEVEFDQR